MGIAFALISIIALVNCIRGGEIHGNGDNVSITLDQCADSGVVEGAYPVYGPWNENSAKVIKFRAGNPNHFEFNFTPKLPVEFTPF